MRAIHRKLLREVNHHRGQMISIAAVVAVGMMVVLTMRGTYESLVLSRDLYYASARFPDVWATLERAPDPVLARIQQIPGVTAADVRVTFTATLDVPGVDAPAMGRFVSIPDTDRSTIGDVHLLEGRYVDPGNRDEVLISENFALANDYGPGDEVRAVINGRARTLEIVGVAISPEHSYAVPPGSLFPDDQRYGIFWMARSVLGPAYDMDGAFNEVVLRLGPGADTNSVLAELDRILDPYGGLGAYAREDQPSHMMLQGELDQNRTMGTVIPAIFLGIAAFLLNIVLNRLIATQRTEIAVLKAFGYTNWEVGLHYFNFALVAVLAGTVVGSGLGTWLGSAMVDLYGDYFRFPVLRYVLSLSLIVIAALISLAAAGAGAIGAVRRAVSLPPAEAMRAEPPASFKPGLFERLGIGQVLTSSGRMILRNVERQPIRSLFSAIGVAFAVAILIVGLFMFDGIEQLMRLQFRVAQREDLSITFNRPVSERVRYDLAALDGVGRVEPYRVVPVRLHQEHREYEMGITGMDPANPLRRIITARGGVQPLPPEGLVLSSLVAESLRLEAGDTVTVEVLEGQRRVAEVPVAGVVEDFIGVSAYMRLGALHDLVRGPESVNGAFITIDDGARSALNQRLKALPVVASVASPAEMLATFEAQLAESLFISIFFLVFFSGIIAVAVIYNGARIALSERGRELASLRVLGFSRREVAVLLLGEQGIITLVAIPIGFVIGYILAAGVVAGLETETFRVPFIVSGRTYLAAAAVAVVAALLSGWIVRRRLDRMDLIAVLKTRE